MVHGTALIARRDEGQFFPMFRPWALALRRARKAMAAIEKDNLDSKLIARRICTSSAAVAKSAIGSIPSLKYRCYPCRSNI